MKLLAIDIETSPIQAYVWSLFNNHSISVDQIIKPTSILCWAAKWVGVPGVMFHKTHIDETNPAVKHMLQDIHALISQADAVLHYNGASFDMPRLNTEFLRLGMKPPPPCPQIDLLKVIQSKFSMTSNKLAFVGPYLKVGEKVKHAGWDLWKGCLAGEKGAWALMEKYNKQDVVLLEKLYNRVLPWIDGHPNMGLFEETDKPVCPNCGSKKLTFNGRRLTATTEYRRAQCQSCGRWSKARLKERTAKTVKVC